MIEGRALNFWKANSLVLECLNNHGALPVIFFPKLRAGPSFLEKLILYYLNDHGALPAISFQSLGPQFLETGPQFLESAEIPQKQPIYIYKYKPNKPLHFVQPLFQLPSITIMLPHPRLRQSKLHL